MQTSVKLLVFLVLSIPIVIISWRSLSSFRNHGWYRFISWECILWLAVNQSLVWFKTPTSWYQMISWILLLMSIWPLVTAVRQLKSARKTETLRQDQTLYGFEKTTELITDGIYRYIRHPMYASLFYLTWGVFFKNPDWILLIFAAISTLSLFVTARLEEIENIAYFGEPYRILMKKTKRFVPFIF